MSAAHTSPSIVLGKDIRLAPEGWVFVTNDPAVSDRPERMFSLLNKSNNVVLIGDVVAETFEVIDLREKSRMNVRHVSSDPSAPWRVGRTPFRDIGEIGRAFCAVLSKDHPRAA